MVSDGGLVDLLLRFASMATGAGPSPSRQLAE
jgi:hypothetical protein